MAVAHCVAGHDTELLYLFIKNVFMRFKEHFSPKNVGTLICRHQGRRISYVGSLAMVRQVALAVLNLLTVVVLSRLLPPSVFGLVAMATFFQTFIGTIVQSSFAESIIQATEFSLSQINKIFWMNASLGLIAATSLLVISPFAVNFYAEPRLYEVFFVISTIILIQVAFIPFQSLLERNLLIELTTVCAIVPAIVSLLVAVTLALLGYEIWALLSSMLANSITRALLLLLFVRWMPGRFSKDTNIQSMVKYGLRNTAGAFAGFFSRNIQVLALGKWASPADIAFYNRGQALFQLPVRQFASPMVNVVFPLMCKDKENRTRLLELVLRSTWTIGLALLPLAAIFICFGDFVTVFLLGEPWRVSGEIVRFLALAEVPTLLLMALARSNAAIGRPARGMLITFYTLPLIVGGVIYFASSGAVAIAQFIVCVRWVFFVLYLKSYLKDIGFSTMRYTKSILLLIAMLLVIVISGLALRVPFSHAVPLMGVCVSCGFGVLAYLMMGFFFSRSTDGRCVLIWLIDTIRGTKYLNKAGLGGRVADQILAKLVVRYKSQ